MRAETQPRARLMQARDCHLALRDTLFLTSCKLVREIDT